MLSKEFYNAKEEVINTGILHNSYNNEEILAKEERILLRIYYHTNRAATILKS